MPVTIPAGCPSVDLASLGDFKVSEILYQAEEPIVFVVSIDSRRKLVAYLADHNAEGRWLLVAPCGTRSLKELKSGSLPVRDALLDSWTWLVRLGADERPQAAWLVGESDIPTHHLPSENLPLLPEHEPVLSTKALGPQIVPGDIPASAIAFVADGTRHAVKALLDFILERPAAQTGRPPEDIRELY